MTLEQHLKAMIGDLVLTVARLQAELDARPPAPPTPQQHVDPPAGSPGD